MVKNKLILLGLILLVLPIVSAKVITQKEFDYIKDNAWKTTKQEYITENIDFDFKYIGDNTYKVDWKVNEEFKNDVIQCYDGSESIWEWIQGIFTEVNVFDYDTTKCGEEIVVEVLYNSQSDKYYWNNKGESEENDSNLELINVSIERLEWINKKYFENFSKTQLEIDLSANEIPIKELVITDNKLKFKEDIDDWLKNEITINYIEYSEGYFYVYLLDGFIKSNGATAKFGFDTTTIEFNNSLGNIPKLVVYEYINENLSRQVPVYEEEVIIVDPIYVEANDTWTTGYNYTKNNLIGYETKYYNGKRIGANIGGIIYDNPSVNVNEKEGYLYICNVPLGDRNWKEYPMRQYEIDKGVCELKPLI